jgi:hypothetical protein
MQRFLSHVPDWTDTLILLGLMALMLFTGR